ncbi:hypothetical protein DM02DRAFT_297579 [Periconia macrospinosa]|uniref:Uncharacterized protein n=1 Tax=Periconia macrospinosa TaxID=97972 RepID=A0A2V1D2C3_9PLEO|nr:hypothetical protein DM02DRAFT_297579 [Periconia macrospinosa]
MSNASLNRIQAVATHPVFGEYVKELIYDLQNVQQRVRSIDGHLALLVLRNTSCMAFDYTVFHGDFADHLPNLKTLDVFIRVPDYYTCRVVTKQRRLKSFIGGLKSLSGCSWALNTPNRIWRRREEEFDEMADLFAFGLPTLCPYISTAFLSSGPPT